MDAEGELGGQVDYADVAVPPSEYPKRCFGHPPRRAVSPGVAGRTCVRRRVSTPVVNMEFGPQEGAHVLLVVGMRGALPEGPAAKREYSFILLHTSADKRSGGVSGARRGG
jgi:hypothetical protein